jgi:hypothetical protein
MKIEGKIKYQKLSGGFWGIIDKDGNKWRPTKLPKKMKEEGLTIKATIKEVSTESISIFMWGTSVEILEFEIIG